MDLQQIKKDRENGVLLGTVTIDKLVAYALELDAHAAQRYEAGRASAFHDNAVLVKEADKWHERAEAAEASLARLVEGIEGLRKVEGRGYVFSDSLIALLPAKAETSNLYKNAVDGVYGSEYQGQVDTPAPAMGEELPASFEATRQQAWNETSKLIEGGVAAPMSPKFMEWFGMGYRACMALRQPGDVLAADHQALRSQWAALDKEIGGKAFHVLAFDDGVNVATPAAPVSKPAAQEHKPVAEVVKKGHYHLAIEWLPNGAEFCEEGTKLYTAPAPLSAQEGSEQEKVLYTCIGKGGEYAFVGYAKGAGILSNIGVICVYRSSKEPDELYFRSKEDFANRMELIK